jgi:hypothetical protein
MMKRLFFKLSLMVAFFLYFGTRSNCQSNPEDYKKGTIVEQMDLLESRTRIYENFRSIREDIFELVSKNIKDSAKTAKRSINLLVTEVATLNSRIDSINKSLEVTNSSLEEITRTKNNIGVLGLEINKILYNTITWCIIGLLVFLLGSGYLVFKKNNSTRIKAKNELADLQKEFEDYRQKKRIELDKITVSHFNEIKKLKAEFTKR